VSLPLEETMFTGRPWRGCLYIQVTSIQSNRFIMNHTQSFRALFYFSVANFSVMYAMLGLIATWVLDQCIIFFVQSYLVEVIVFNSKDRHSQHMWFCIFILIKLKSNKIFHLQRNSSDLSMAKMVFKLTELHIFEWKLKRRKPKY
jgi:hypothetical protein